MSETQLSAADLLALLRRTTDDRGWLDPILEDPDGAAALGAAVAIFERTSAAVAYDSLAATVSDSPGGAAGTTTLRVARAAAGTSGTIPAGYLFLDGRGAKLRVATPVPVAAGALALSIPLETLRQTEALNTVDGPTLVVDASSGVLLDSLATTALLAPPGDLAIVATTFLPVDADPIVGAASDWLSVIGGERGQERQAGEPTESYRARVRSIPDAVSPAAVGDGVQAAASRIGIAAILLEPFDDGAEATVRARHGLGVFPGLFWSATNFEGTAAAAAASPAADFFDDAGDGREIRDRRTALGYFRIDLDGVFLDPAGATFFLDGRGYWDDDVRGFVDVGTPPSVNSQGNAIWEEANRKKAGGVNFDVGLRATRKIVDRGTTAAAGDTVVLTLAPPAGSVWIVGDLVVGHDSASTAFPPGAVLPAAARHFVRFTFSDATTFSTPAYAGGDSEHLTPDRLAAAGCPLKPIATVEVLARSDGTVVVGAAIALYVLEMVLP